MYEGFQLSRWKRHRRAHEGRAPQRPPAADRGLAEQADILDHVLPDDDDTVDEDVESSDEDDDDVPPPPDETT